MLIDVPEHVADALCKQLNSIIEDIELKKEHEADIDRLNSEYSLEWFEKKHPHALWNGPIVRSSVYKDQDIFYWQYIRGWRVGVEDPPVRMKGSKDVCHYKYCKSRGQSNPHGWHEHVMRRYIRMHKVTVIPHPNSRGIYWEDKEWERISKMFARFGCYAKEPFVGHAGGCWIGYIRGKRFMVNHDSLNVIKSIYRHINKLTQIDVAIQKLHDHERRNQHTV